MSGVRPLLLPYRTLVGLPRSGEDNEVGLGVGSYGVSGRSLRVVPENVSEKTPTPRPSRASTSPVQVLPETWVLSRHGVNRGGIFTS